MGAGGGGQKCGGEGEQGGEVGAGARGQKGAGREERERGKGVEAQAPPVELSLHCTLPLTWLPFLLQMLSFKSIPLASSAAQAIARAVSTRGGGLPSVEVRLLTGQCVVGVGCLWVAVCVIEGCMWGIGCVGRQYVRYGMTGPAKISDFRVILDHPPAAHACPTASNPLHHPSTVKPLSLPSWSTPTPLLPPFYVSLGRWRLTTGHPHTHPSHTRASRWTATPLPLSCPHPPTASCPLW